MTPADRTNARRWPAAAALLVALLAAPLPWTAARATTYLRLGPDQMLDKADIVFVGTVSSVSVSVKNGRPWTAVTFDVGTPIEGIATDANGKATGPKVLSFLGGDATGGPALTVSGMPSFKDGERVLVFAYDQAYASPIVGFRQGLWQVTDAGLVGLDGRRLSLDANGDLVAGGAGAPLQQIIAAIVKHLGAKAGGQ